MNINNIYQDIILEHNKYPRNYYKMKDANLYLKGDNPLCGDNLEIFCITGKNIIQDISFYGNGCAISKASASIMTYLVKKNTTHNVLKIFKTFHRFLIGKGNDLYKIKKLEPLLVFGNIKKKPSRLKCAMLAWYTLKALIEHK